MRVAARCSPTGIAFCFAMLVSLAAPAGAARLLPGTPLRVHVASAAAGGARVARHEGWLVSTGDTITLRVPAASGTESIVSGLERDATIRVALSDVVRVEIQDRPRRRSVPNTIAGAVLGGGLGLLGGFFYSIDEDHNVIGLGVTYATTAAGALLGGWLAGRHPSGARATTWREVPASWLRES